MVPDSHRSTASVPAHLLHRYRVLGPLGEGGLGQALRVWDEVSEEERALKVVSRDALALLRHEFSLLAGLFHPRVVRVHDFGTFRHAGRVGGFYTADLQRGVSLGAFAASHPWPATRRAIADALEGLAFLHRLGIRHGDFKPDNVIVDPEGRATLLDLSCASRLDEPVRELGGTPGFMAPELAPGAVVDVRADLFAVGATLAALGKHDAAVPKLAAALQRTRPGDRPAEVADVLAALGEERTLGALRSGKCPHLVGREAEVSLFTELLLALRQDETAARALFVWGAPGIGKTRLLAELKWLTQEGCDVAETPPENLGRPRRDAVHSLLRRAGTSIDGAGATPSLDAVLHAADELALGPRPTVLFVDDAEQLAPRDLDHLAAVLRSLRDDGRLMLVVAAARPIELDGAAVVTRELRPLSLDATRRWAGDWVSPHNMTALAQVTGGHPAYLEATLRQIANGTTSETALMGSTVSVHGHLAREVAQITEEERRALALVVVHGGRLDSARCLGLGACLTTLASGGWVVPDSDGFALARPTERAALEDALDATGALAPAFRSVVTTSNDPAVEVLGWVRLGSVPEAEGVLDRLHREARRRSEGHGARSRADPSLDTLRSDENLHGAAAQRWSDALMELAAASQRARTLLQAAASQLGLGRARRALTALSRLLRRRPDRHTRARCHALAGAALLQLEQPARAVRYLTLALAAEEVPSGDDTGHPIGASLAPSALAANETNPPTDSLDTERVYRPAVAAKLARALNQTGDYAAALAVAERHLAALGAGDSAVAAELRSALGVAATYLGQSERAEAELERAAADADALDPRDAARAHSYLAILAFRRGAVEAAAEHHAEALSVAERHDLTDMIPTLVLNHGTARQQLGRWGDAIAAYERGHRLATAVGKAQAAAILQLNLANLYADIGLTERARATTRSAANSVKAAGITHLQGALDTIAGEIAFVDGDRHAALDALEAARDEHRRRAELREAAEVCVTLGLVHLGSDEREGARRHLEDARRHLEGVDAGDVEVRLRIAEGQLAFAEGDPARSGALLTEAVSAAEALRQPLLVADACLALAKTLRPHQPERAVELDERARARWRDVEATLPEAMRDVFWRHPRRRALASAGGEQPPTRRTVDVERLRRVLTLTAKVSSSLSVDRVLELAMDGAIELTGAERGFLLLREEGAEGELRVAVARNVDRERLARGELEFSTSIAEQVLHTGEPVVTLDARGDMRFSAQRSVHAMRLKSVLCVPVVAQGSVLGTLYLDNRFAHGRFAEDDITIVTAFTGHIAMAVRNARLHAALEQNHRQLLAEKRRVERLSRGQAQQIEVLEERVRSQQQVLERRYDYSSLVHRSPAMQRVFDVLDRVIDSELTVLVQGESGTGKELVARAIHFNSPRREGPFVGVNCGALSETLLESELFGHVRGAFTGADRDRDGLMVAARGGTLFLDEIGELSLAMQVKLLRALQEREVRPLGSSDTVSLDVRVVCATNRDLRSEVSAGRFREDLYYRIGVVEVRLPPLSEREDDVIPIARAVLDRLAARAGNEPPELGRDATRALLGYRWPGNVRQLENVLARAYVLSDRRLLRAEDLELSAAPRAESRPRSRADFEQGEAERIHDALLAHRWNVSQAARALGIPRNTLYRKMRRLNLAREGDARPTPG